MTKFSNPATPTRRKGNWESGSFVLSRNQKYRSFAAELEWAMEFNGEETELTSRQQEVLSIYRKLNRANQHKMNPIPICMIPEELKD